MGDWSSLIDSDTLDQLPASASRELLHRALSQRDSPANRRVFTNRTLRMEKIRCVGFDLDWTLANYRQEALSKLVFDLTISRLIDAYGYSPELEACEFRPEFNRRGLILDTERGTVLKMNRHRYVGRAYFGRHSVSRKERARFYRSHPLNPASQRYYHVDTLFELAELNVFSEVVELQRKSSRLELSAKPTVTFEKIFSDIRSATDSLHEDGTLKTALLGDLPRYLERDPDLIIALRRLNLGDRKLILITNSEWYFTDGVCSHLFDGIVPGFGHWRSIFDLVITSARKPGFFRKQIAFDELDESGNIVAHHERPEWGGCYSGGCREGLMKLLGCQGEEVLYVGDHIYGDIVSSKLSSTWRTALVVSELEDELAVRHELSSQIRHLDVLRAELAAFGHRMDDLEDISILYRGLTSSNDDAPTLQRVAEYLSELRSEHRALRLHARRLQKRISEAINPCWGSLFKQGSSKSLFGSQVDDFACLYTSRVSNFAFYGSNHYYRVLGDSMRHE